MCVLYAYMPLLLGFKKIFVGNSQIFLKSSEALRQVKKQQFKMKPNGWTDNSTQDSQVKEWCSSGGHNWSVTDRVGNLLFGFSLESLNFRQKEQFALFTLFVKRNKNNLLNSFALVALLKRVMRAICSHCLFKKTGLGTAFFYILNASFF